MFSVPLSKRFLATFWFSVEAIICFRYFLFGRILLLQKFIIYTDSMYCKPTTDLVYSSITQSNWVVRFPENYSGICEFEKCYILWALEEANTPLPPIFTMSKWFISVRSESWWHFGKDRLLLDCIETFENSQCRQQRSIDSIDIIDPLNVSHRSVTASIHFSGISLHTWNEICGVTIS